MNFWFNFLKALITTGPTPTMFGAFHIVGIVILLGLCVGLPFLNRKINKKGYKITLLCCWITLVVLELFKQLTLCYKIEGEVIRWFMPWMYFPFQFCSIPFYLLPFIIFMKDTNWFKIRAELFSAIFFMVGGIMGSFMPSFTDIQWLNYHTLIHHFLMILLSILIALQARKQFRFRTLIETLPIYFGFLITALILNAAIPAIWPNAISWQFNMWFISWKYPPTLPIISDAWKAMPYPAYLLLYILGSLFLVFVIYVIFSACINRRVDFNIHSEKWLALHAKDKTKIVSAKNEKATK